MRATVGRRAVARWSMAVPRAAAAPPTMPPTASGSSRCACRGATEDPYLTEIASHLIAGRRQAAAPGHRRAGAQTDGRPGGVRRGRARRRGVRARAPRLALPRRRDGRGRHPPRRGDGQRPVGQPAGDPRRRLPARPGLGDRRLARHRGRRAARRTIGRLCEGQIAELRTTYDTSPAPRTPTSRRSRGRRPRCSRRPPASGRSSASCPGRQVDDADRVRPRLRDGVPDRRRRARPHRHRRRAGQAGRPRHGRGRLHAAGASARWQRAGRPARSWPICSASRSTTPSGRRRWRSCAPTEPCTAPSTSPPATCARSRGGLRRALARVAGHRRARATASAALLATVTAAERGRRRRARRPPAMGASARASPHRPRHPVEELEHDGVEPAPCSTMKPWAAPEITTSSAPGISSASSSLSPRGVSTSWLPTIDEGRHGAWSASSSAQRVVGGEDRLGPGRRSRRRTGSARAGRSSPKRRRSRRRIDRGPTTQRTASSATAACLCEAARSIHSPSSSRRHGGCAAGGAGERQGADAVRDGGWRGSGDDPAHRGADEVGRPDPGGVEHGDGVVGHLQQRVGAERLVAAAGTPVVEGDRAVAAGEGRPLQGPAVDVGAEAVDQQHRLAVGPPERS